MRETRRALARSGMMLCMTGLAAAASAQTGPRDPATIYAKTCGYCHGHNVGPIILGRKLPAELVTMMVRHGKGAMPAFRPTEITPAELTGLARWIATAPAAPKEHGQ